MNQGGRDGRRTSPAFGGQLETWPVCVATTSSSSYASGPQGCVSQPAQAEITTRSMRCLRECRRAALQGSDSVAPQTRLEMRQGQCFSCRSAVH